MQPFCATSVNFHVVRFYRNFNFSEDSFIEIDSWIYSAGEKKTRIDQYACNALKNEYVKNISVLVTKRGVRNFQCNRPSNLQVKIKCRVGVIGFHKYKSLYAEGRGRQCQDPSSGGIPSTAVRADCIHPSRHSCDPFSWSTWNASTAQLHKTPQIWKNYQFLALDSSNQAQKARSNFFYLIRFTYYSMYTYIGFWTKKTACFQTSTFFSRL